MKNEKTIEGRKPAGQAIFANQFCFNISKKNRPPPPLAQGLDPPLLINTICIQVKHHFQWVSLEVMSAT